jgi:hypothetical protein
VLEGDIEQARTGLRQALDLRIHLSDKHPGGGGEPIVVLADGTARAVDLGRHSVEQRAEAHLAPPLLPGLLPGTDDRLEGWKGVRDIDVEASTEPEGHRWNRRAGFTPRGTSAPPTFRLSLARFGSTSVSRTPFGRKTRLKTMGARE